MPQTCLMAHLGGKGAFSSLGAASVLCALCDFVVCVGGPVAGVLLTKGAVTPRLRLVAFSRTTASQRVLIASTTA